MKKLLISLFVLLLLAGCSVQKQPQEEPTVSQEASTETLDVPMTEEEAAAAQAAKAEELEERAKNKSLPLGSFTAPTLTGETVDESIFADADLTVVNLWATYCSPCKEEMPILAALHESLSGDVQILGIVLDCTDADGNAIDSQVTLAQELAEEAGCGYSNLLFNEDLANLGLGSVSSVPATLFIDRAGNTVGQGFYGALDENGWQDVIAERLEIARGRYQ